jgi:Domain of unknown function (DUF4190)
VIEAMASTVLFPVVPSVLAIWLGVTARHRIRDDATLDGEGMATAGVILGVVGLVLVVVGAVLLFALLFATTSGGGNPGPVVTVVSQP